MGTGSSREAEQDCCVPLDLRRPALGLFGKKREALCVPPSTWIWVLSVCALLGSWANSLDFRSQFEGHLQKLVESGRG